ncbi:MAG TPA: aminotransferase class V-fold PLP-dependent enzyme, partial [Solirubrobacteraceae bacterium]|nr:aminotransferase class V-fold PLP-dependent enzyme [Solirubrobacteraceae bacterium]
MHEEEQDRDPLALDAEAMRAFGYRTVDMLVQRLCDPSIPPLQRASPREMRARLAGPPPAAGREFDAILERLGRDVLPYMSRGDHPGFLAFIPFSGTWPGALGDFIASACNIYAGSWMESAGPTQLELEVLNWFKAWIGYPADAGGVLVGGGSAANLTAIACARETLGGHMSDDLVGYVSDQAHSSLARAARVLGFRPRQLRVLPSDDRFRIDPRILAAAMDADVRAGRRPLFVSATAGTTSTGAIDPLAAIARLCRERGVWMHVDAAYGGFAALTEHGRTLLSGIEAADSVTLDPHKWLYQPYECGALLVRDDDALRGAFQMTPDYLQDAFAADEVNLSDRGVQLTRSSRALKVWMSLQYFGVDAFAAAIGRALDLAGRVCERVRASDALELMAPPSLGIVCFRRRFADAADEDEVDGHNAGLVVALEQSGLGLVSSTMLRGRYALRVCVLNHTTGRDDVDRIMD